MLQYSKKERAIAGLLSSMPLLKTVVKRLYVTLNYFIYNSKVPYKIYDNRIKILESIHQGNDETFFGYYDKSPENANGEIIYSCASIKTAHRPSAKNKISIHLYDPTKKEDIAIDDSYSYNWQQSCRTIWLDNDCFIYNVYENNKYCSKVFNIRDRKIVRTFDRPVQDAFGKQYYLSINYRRIMRLRPDYGYRNLPVYSDKELGSLNDDGIWKVDYNTGISTLIISLEELTRLAPKQGFASAFHKLNHVMISPDGKKFIFIHRWYISGRRYDRLIISDGRTHKILADEDMVSHMCWVNNSTLFGYLRYNGENGFYFINIENGLVTPCDTVNKMQTADGHPSCYGDWIVFDSYPDKSGMQKLHLYNHRTQAIYKLLEVKHSPRYFGETRCDLHPRFSLNGERVYFDSVRTGRRSLCFIDVSCIIN